MIMDRGRRGALHFAPNPPPDLQQRTLGPFAGVKTEARCVCTHRYLILACRQEVVMGKRLPDNFKVSKGSLVVCLEGDIRT